MSRKPIGRRRVRQARTGPAGTSVAAGKFKATCLELMDRVRETRVEYVITKHGRPVAKLVPFTEPERRPFFGSLKGTVLGYARPLDPLDDDWNINHE